MVRASTTEPAQDKPLLLNFSGEPGYTVAKRATLKECAALLGVSETKAAHIAINRLWLQLTGKDSVEFDFPANLPEYKPTPKERASTKASLNAFFDKTLSGL